MMSAASSTNDRMPATAWLRENELVNTPIAMNSNPDTAMKV